MLSITDMKQLRRISDGSIKKDMFLRAPQWVKLIPPPLFPDERYGEELLL